MPIIVTPDDQPVELAAGRGDLRRNSIPFDQFMGGPFWNGRPVSYAKIFLTQPWVAIAVYRLLTWSVRVPLKVYRRLDDSNAPDGSDRRRLKPDEHPLARAVVAPWENGSMAELVMSILGPLFVHGNDLMDVDQGRSGALRFEPVDWRFVTPVVLDKNDPNSEVQGWTVRRGNSEERKSTDTVMHLKWWSPMGQMGISPLEHIRTTIVNEEAAIYWQLNQLSRGVRPTGVVQAAEKFLEETDAGERQKLMEQLKSDLAEIYAGPENAGRVPVLPPGLQWADTKQTSAVEAELMQQRFVNRNETAAIYMLPPGVIGQLEKSNYSNLQAQREMAYTDSLAPPMVIAEQKINAHLIRGLLREDDVFVEFDFAGVLRGDRLKEIQALREAIGSGLLTPNEGREVLNKKKSDLPGADMLWLPQNNLKPLTEEGMESAKPKPPPEPSGDDETEPAEPAKEEALA